MVVELLKSAYEHQTIVRVTLKNQEAPLYGWVTGGHQLNSASVCDRHAKTSGNYSFSFYRIDNYDSYIAAGRSVAPQISLELFNSSLVKEVVPLD